MKKKKTISMVLIYAVLILGSLIMVFPFIWMLLTAVKTNAEVLQVPLSLEYSSLKQFRQSLWLTDIFLSTCYIFYIGYVDLY